VTQWLGERYWDPAVIGERCCDQVVRVLVTCADGPVF